MAVTGIKNKATYSFGQVVRPKYSCAQPTIPPRSPTARPATTSATRSPPGQAEHDDSGPHTLTVTATNTVGLSTTDDINYRVLPDSRFTIGDVSPKHHGALGFALALPGPGTVRCSSWAEARGRRQRHHQVTQKRHLKSI